MNWKEIDVKTLYIVMQENHDIFIFSAPSSSNNTGTIVASVVFVILLLLILAALLVFYLRTKQKASASIRASSVSHISCTSFDNQLYDSGDTVSFLAVHVFVLCKSFNLKEFTKKK